MARGNDGKGDDPTSMSGTVLLVDDDADSRFIYETVLTRAGYRVMLASDGLEAVIAAGLTIPDLVLLDLSMPRMDGPATFTALQADVSTRGVPVIALTAKASIHQIPQLLSFGFRDVLLKPVLPARVVSVVRETLQGFSDGAR
jgi:CheY-like chemotaxis protein